MSDLFEETFAALDAYYPGSKRKRREPKPEVPQETLDSSWEQDYVVKHLPNGTTTEMYTLGSLAKALNRSVKTLRDWIDFGHIPTSPYRAPSSTGKNGKVYAGKRLYSKRMVQAAVEIFANAGLLSPSRVDWSLHRNLADKIAEAWDKIRADELQTTNKG